jgi:anti-sigma-K factor RskA
MDSARHDLSQGLCGTVIPDDPHERDLLAGEFVLGVLDRTSSVAMLAALEIDADLRDHVEQWQNRLQPLAEAIPAVLPPRDLWRRIEAALVEQPKARDARRATRSNDIWLWLFGSAAAAGLSAALAMLILVVGPREPVEIAVLTAPSSVQAQFMVTRQPGGGFVLTSLAGSSAPAGHALELWALAPGAHRPTSLGVIPSDGRLVFGNARFAPRAGTALLISLEPARGSPTGQPTGPVMFQGQLVLSG